MKKLFQGNRYKKFFYFVCFLILCVCDQRIGSASGEIQLVCPNISFIVLGCLVLSHYLPADFRRPSFWIPAMVCVAAGCIVLYLMWPDTRYPYQLISGAFAGIVYGCVLIQTAHAVFFERQFPRGSHLGGWLMGLLLVLILLSRYDKYNGFLLCLSVVLIYLTDFEPQERDWMLRSLGYAVLTAFFIFQGLSFVFRPFDSGRYHGLYANPNINALFYQIVYCVFLGFFCTMEMRREHRLLKWVSFCFACAMWPFVLLTMCRSAVLGMAVATFLGYGIVLWKRREARVRRGLLYVCGLVLGCVVSSPVVYGTVRYLPAVFHHPIWFEGEYSQGKVHSWDPYDSEKYTDWRDVIQGNLGRLFPDAVSSDISREEDSRKTVILTGEKKWRTVAFEAVQNREAKVPAAMQNSRNLNVRESGQCGKRLVPAVVLVGSVISGKEKAFSGADMISEIEPGQATVMKSSVNARFVIYRHYFSGLNLWGHRDAENGFQYSDSYYAPHAHNILLQYAFNYGMPAGIVFLIYLALSGIWFLRLCVRDESDTPFLMGLLLFAAIATFGMTEMVWRYGQLSHTLLLILPCFAWQQEISVSDKTI